MPSTHDYDYPLGYPLVARRLRAEPNDYGYRWDVSRRRAEVLPHWETAKELRRYSKELIERWKPADYLKPLRLTMDPVPHDMPYALAYTIVSVHREWNDRTGTDSGWYLALSWTLHLRRMKEYVDPVGAGKECLRHELAHILHAPERLSYLESQNIDRTEFMTAWDTLKSDPVHGEHGLGWREWCWKIGCSDTPDIDNRYYPRKYPAMAWA